MSFISSRLLANRKCGQISLRRYSTLWESLEDAPFDPIMGITEQFHADKNPKKINLALCMYVDDMGQTFALTSVLKAEKQVQSRVLPKDYLPITGLSLFCKQCVKIALGENSKLVTEDLVATAQSISATGSLRIAFDFIKKFFPGNKIVYMSNPTWSNYPTIASQVGLEVGYYKYFNFETFNLDFAGLMDDINKMPNTSVIILQACGHNPTGLDPTHEQWDEMSQLIKKKNILPFFDMSYQGVISGDPDEDAYSVRKFVEDGNQIIVIQSYSKNMGLYGERIGAATFACRNQEEKKNLLSQLMIIIRGMYSTPPINGSRIVTTLLDDPGLKTEWKKEVKMMSERCSAMRRELKDYLNNAGSKKNWDHLTKQVGYLSMTGLTPPQIKKLVDDFGIYLCLNGRMSVSGLTKKNIEYVANAFYQVTKE